MSSKLTRVQIIDALRALEAECARRGITGEICIYGGALMVLVYDARDSTRDVDAVFRPKSKILAAAQSVAEQLGLLVERFYPADRIHIRTRYFVEEIMAELKGREGEEAV